MRRTVAIAICLLFACASPSRADFYKCFRYAGATVTTLPTLGGLDCHATDINDAGQVVGLSSLPPGQGTHAFVWNGGVPTDLGTLGGTDSRAVAINDAGQIRRRGCEREREPARVPLQRRHDDRSRHLAGRRR